MAGVRNSRAGDFAEMVRERYGLKPALPRQGRWVPLARTPEYWEFLAATGNQSQQECQERRRTGLLGRGSEPR